MAESGPAKGGSGRRSGATRTEQVFSAEERAAMREYAREKRAASGRGASADGTADVLAKIAEMSPADREIAARVHELVTTTAPGLTPRTWYGMPAYSNSSGVVCFLQPAEKFKSRYATLGFSDKANLDDGQMWPTSYALQALSPEVEDAIRALVERATR